MTTHLHILANLWLLIWKLSPTCDYCFANSCQSVTTDLKTLTNLWLLFCKLSTICDYWFENSRQSVTTVLLTLVNLWLLFCSLKMCDYTLLWLLITVLLSVNRPSKVTSRCASTLKPSGNNLLRWESISWNFSLLARKKITFLVAEI